MSNKKKLYYPAGNPDTFEKQCERTLDAPRALRRSKAEWDSKTYQEKQQGPDKWPNTKDMPVLGKRR